MLPRAVSLFSAALLLLGIPAVAQTDILVTRQNVAPGDDGQRVAGAEATASFLVSNIGPQDARNVVVTFEYSPSLGLAHLGGDLGNCSGTSTSMRCTAGDLIASDPACCKYYSAGFSTPREPQTAVVKVTVTSDTPESNKDNNSVTFTWNLVLRADLHVSMNPPLSRVDPGASVDIRTQVNNWLPTSPTDIQVDFEAKNGGTIEKIAAPDGWLCSVQAQSAHCTAATLDENCRCSREFVTTLRTTSDRAGARATLVAQASSAFPDDYTPNNTATAAVETYRWIVVRSTADEGEGSLRAAIQEANRGCTSDPCKIAFEIPGPPPESGWFTIAPSSSLPAITAPRVVVEGSTQTALTGDTNPAGPEVAIDGRFTAEGDGLEIRSRCEGVIDQLAIGNFRGYGLVSPIGAGICPDGVIYVDGASFRVPDRRLITNNYIGTDPTGTQAWPNLRGIRADDASFVTIAGNVISGNVRSGIWMWGGWIDITQNRIGTAADGKTPLPNGASGIFLGPQTQSSLVLYNSIAFHPHMGVAVFQGARRVIVRANSMFGNAGLPIDHDLDGPSPASDLPDLVPNAPALLSATYDAAAGRTMITLTLRTTLAFGVSSTIDFYGSNGPDGDGGIWLGSAYVWSNSNEQNPNGVPFTVSMPRDARGLWISASSSRVDFPDAPAPSYAPTGTSEFSNSVLVAP